MSTPIFTNIKIYKFWASFDINFLTLSTFNSNTNTLEFMYAMLSACDRVKAKKGEEKVAADDAN